MSGVDGEVGAGDRGHLAIESEAVQHGHRRLSLPAPGAGVTDTHSDTAASVASKTFTDGLSGIWYQWLFASPFYWLIAPVMRRFSALTTVDVFKARFSLQRGDRVRRGVSPLSAPSRKRVEAANGSSGLALAPLA